MQGKSIIHSIHMSNESFSLSLTFTEFSTLWPVVNKCINDFGDGGFLWPLVDTLYFILQEGQEGASLIDWLREREESKTPRIWIEQRKHWPVVTRERDSH